MVKRFEGKYLEAYVCPAGVWTIGYGHTGMVDGAPIAAGMKITEEKAEELLHLDMEKFERAVTRLVQVSYNQNQFDALVSFAFNCGEGALQKSTLLRKLNAGDYLGAAGEFARWNKGGGKVLPGLTKRRAAEKELFLKPVKEEDVPEKKKIKLIINGVEHYVDGFFQSGTNYVAIRPVLEAVGCEVKAQGNTPVITSK